MTEEQTPGKSAPIAGLSSKIADNAEQAALNAPADSFLNKPELSSGVVYLHAGKSHRPFDFNTAQLAANSPYFKRYFAENERHDGLLGSEDQNTFEDVDEVSMALLKHWLDSRGKLAGPHDFHSLQHYLGLYVLARKFDIEALQNQGKHPRLLVVK